MIRTPSPLRGTPPIAPFLFATEGELGCVSWKQQRGELVATIGITEGELAATLGTIRVSWMTHP